MPTRLLVDVADVHSAPYVILQPPLRALFPAAACGGPGRGSAAATRRTGCATPLARGPANAWPRGAASAAAARALAAVRSSLWGKRTHMGGRRGGKGAMRSRLWAALGLVRAKTACSSHA
jgi:hypothetical protein